MTGVGGLPSGVVFDCDGTLIDTEPLARRSIEATLGEMGLRLTDEDFLAMVGRAWPESSRHLMDVIGVRDIEGYRVRLSAIFAERYHAEVEVFADAVGVAASVVAAGVPLGVCTSSGLPHLTRALAMPGMRELRGAATVTREDTDQHKPHPAPYLLAAARMGIAPDECVAVEDSPTGATSAAAAGMRVVVVDRGNHLPEEFASLGLTPVTTLTLDHLAG